MLGGNKRRRRRRRFEFFMPLTIVHDGMNEIVADVDGSIEIAIPH